MQHTSEGPSRESKPLQVVITSSRSPADARTTPMQMGSREKAVIVEGQPPSGNTVPFTVVALLESFSFSGSFMRALEEMY